MKTNLYLRLSSFGCAGLSYLNLNVMNKEEIMMFIQLILTIR